MRILLQRVTQANVRINAKLIAAISRGYVLLVGVGIGDTTREVELLARKIVHLRLLDEASGKRNLSALELNSDSNTPVQMLVVSQFTLFADTRKGRRPSYVAAAPGSLAEPLIDALVDSLRGFGFTVAVGEFGANMRLELVNDGPVTIWLDSHDLANRG
ncbi:MAG: D-aminoacyl-tRNA deacylase [Chloroflexota bacterium]|nr:D-aminoacyl-tRNA deacylase [Chloroflexota bacterium]